MSLTKVQAALIGRSGKDGKPLDPEQPDDAVVLMRAEELVLAGLTGSEALAQARSEMVVYCPVCQRDKRVVRVHGLPGIAWPTCGHRPRHAPDLNHTDDTDDSEPRFVIPPRRPEEEA